VLFTKEKGRNAVYFKDKLGNYEPQFSGGTTKIFFHSIERPLKMCV